MEYNNRKKNSIIEKVRRLRIIARADPGRIILLRTHINVKSDLSKYFFLISLKYKNFIVLFNKCYTIVSNRYYKISHYRNLNKNT